MTTCSLTKARYPERDDSCFPHEITAEPRRCVYQGQTQEVRLLYFLSSTSPERAEDMSRSGPYKRLWYPRLAWCLSLMFIAGLAACGPAPTDNAPRLEPRASLGGPSQAQPVSQPAPAIRTDPVTPAASPASFPLGRSPDGSIQARPAEPLVGPGWMSTALDDEDEGAQTRVSKVIEPSWAVEQERD